MYEDSPAELFALQLKFPAIVYETDSTDRIELRLPILDTFISA